MSTRLRVHGARTGVTTLRWSLGLGWGLQGCWGTVHFGYTVGAEPEVPPHILAPLIDDTAGTRKGKMQQSGTRKRNPLLSAMSFPWSLLIKFSCAHFKGEFLQRMNEGGI